MSTTIGRTVDVLQFVVDLLDGQIVDENDKPVNVTTTYPREVRQIPCVVVELVRHDSKWISIPAYRQRWFAKLMLHAFGTSVGQRFAMEKSLRETIILLTKPPTPTLATNFVFMHLTEHSIEDVPMMFGTPIYRAKLGLEVIYDIFYST